MYLSTKKLYTSSNNVLPETQPPCMIETGGRRVQLCSEVTIFAPLFAFLSQCLKWVMCFWLRPKVLMVITLLSLTLIISCLQGAITEASTSNSAELKKEFKKERDKVRWKHYSSYLMSREGRNIYF